MNTTENQTIQNLIAHVVAECHEADTDQQYDEMLDECFSFESVGGIFACMSPSRVLAKCDEVAYRCGKNDWLDGESDRLVEIDGNYYDKEEVANAQIEFVAELEAEISAMEKDIDDMEAEEFGEDKEDNSAKVLGLSARLDTLRANCLEAERYSFTL